MKQGKNRSSGLDDFHTTSFLGSVEAGSVLIEGLGALIFPILAARPIATKSKIPLTTTITNISSDVGPFSVPTGEPVEVTAFQIVPIVMRAPLAFPPAFFATNHNESLRKTLHITIKWRFCQPFIF